MQSMLSHLHFVPFLFVFLFFFFHGFWLYVLLFPKHSTSLLSLFAFSPILGACALSLYGSNLIWLSKPIPEYTTSIFLVAAVLNLVALWFGWERLARMLPILGNSACGDGAPRRDTLTSIIFCIAVPLALLGPILGVPLTTPWRIGPDAGGYINCASFLLEGKTLDDFSGAFLVPNEIYAYEFMVQALRRGCAAVLAILCAGLGKAPAEGAFLIIAVQLFMLQLVVLWAVRQIFEGSLFTSWLVSSAVVLNCNLLFIFYEGGYAQIASMSLIAAIVFLFRSSTTLENQGIWKTGLLYGLLLAGASELYLESLFVILPLLACYFTYQLFILGERIQPKRYFVALIATVVSFLANWDVLVHWLPFQIDNSNLLWIAGWPQPQWATFPEIMGWIDIYKNVVGNNWNVQNFLSSWALAISELITIYLLVLFFYKLRKRDTAALLGVIPAALVIGSFFYFREIRQVHSYSYMKIYTLVLPFLATGTLLLFSSSRDVSNSKSNMIPIILSSIVIMNGVIFIRSYRADYAYLKSGLIELSVAERTADLSKFVLLTHPDSDKYAGLRELFLRSLVKTKMIHAGFFPQQDFSNFASNEVALIVRRGQSDCKFHAQDILWEGTEYTILNTHISVVEAWKDKSKIKWKPSPKNIPRPEIEVRWNTENVKEKATQDYDFSAYYAKDSCSN
jgi:hypothetical protein